MGVIEMIEMHDFMCHRHLKVPFGPKINFIIGHNGSKWHGLRRKYAAVFSAPGLGLTKVPLINVNT